MVYWFRGFLVFGFWVSGFLGFKDFQNHIMCLKIFGPYYQNFNFMSFDIYIYIDLTCKIFKILLHGSPEFPAPVFANIDNILDFRNFEILGFPELYISKENMF